MHQRTSSTIRRFNYLYAEISAAYHEAALAMGLSDSSMMVLYTIWDQGDRCPLADIPRLTGVSKQTINSALRKLEGEGILSLVSSGGRGKTVCLTEEGKALAASTVARLMDLENGIFTAWSPEEREGYLALTQRYLEDFRAASREEWGQTP